MEERLRQAYLKAMDIEVAYSRRQLRQNSAAAAPARSVAVDIAGEASAARSDETAMGRSVDVAKQSLGLSDAAETMNAAPRCEAQAQARIQAQPEPPISPRISADAPIKQPEESRSGDPQALQFVLQFAWVNDALAVIDELPFARAQEGGAARGELLQAILGAVGVNQAAQDLRYENITWPLAEGMDASPEAAKQMLLGFLEQRLDSQGFANLLVFGSQLLGLLDLGGGDEKGLELGEGGDSVLMLDAAQQLPVTATYTLSALLSHAALKRETWHHLQPLRQRLAQSR